MKKLFMMLSVVITSIVSFAETPVTIYSHADSVLSEDIQFMSDFDFITVMENGNCVEKKIDHIDISFIPSTESAPKDTQVTINVRIYVEKKYCDFLIWIKSRTRPNLNERDVAMDICNDSNFSVNTIIAEYMKHHEMKFVVLAETKKIEKKNPNKKG